MKYQIIVDESVDYRIVLELRNAGFSIYAIAEQPSIKDENVLSIAYQNDALLLTEDKDFGELVFKLNLLNKGVLLIRIEEKGLKIKMIVNSIIENYKKLINNFSVINNKLRIREK